MIKGLLTPNVSGSSQTDYQALAAARQCKYKLKKETKVLS